MDLRLLDSSLRDDEILLRPWTLEDVPAVTAACQDPEIARWIPFIPSPYSEDDARKFIERSLAQWEAGEGYEFAVVDAQSNELLGSIALRVGGMGTGHIGYWVAAKARGRGVATRALRLVCRWALGELELGRLELMTDPENTKSQRVAENAGFRREAVLRSALRYRDGSRADSVIFSLLPGELGES